MLKRLLLSFTHRSGINALLRRTLRGRLLTLCYHTVLPASSIGKTSIYRNTVSLEELEEQIRILTAWFELVTPERALAAAEGDPLDRPSALITFDDGHYNLLEHAAPLLRRLGVPAIVHVTTGHIGTGTPLWTEELEWLVQGWRGSDLPAPDGATRLPVPSHVEGREALAHRIRGVSKTLPDRRRSEYLAALRAEGNSVACETERQAFRFLDWDGVRALRDRGFAIGSHTVDHTILTKLSDVDLDHQLRESRSRIQAELAAPCPFIAYPNGGPSDVSQHVLQRVRAAGYRVGFTTTGGFERPADRPLAIGRVCIPGRLPNETFRAMVSGVHHWWRRAFARG